MTDNKILLGDCMAYIKEMKDNSIDLCLTDPPYGIKRDKGFHDGENKIRVDKKTLRVRNMQNAHRRQYKDVWDTSRPSKEYFDEMLRVSKNVIIFGGNFFADLLPISTHWLVWDKLNTMPTYGDCELIYTSIKRNSVKKYTLQWNGFIAKEEHRLHPTQKPVKLLTEILLNYSKEGDLIFDPFAGSCSLAIACLKINRNFICVEKEQKYFDIGNKRIELTNVKQRIGAMNDA